MSEDGTRRKYAVIGQRGPLQQDHAGPYKAVASDRDGGDNDTFEIDAPLSDRRQGRSLEKFRLIERDCDNADLHTITTATTQPALSIRNFGTSLHSLTNLTKVGPWSILSTTGKLTG